jgi:hypothetical protein
VKVIGGTGFKTVDVAADGTGLSSRPATALLPLVATRLGLTDGLCAALEGTRERRSAHAPGRVFCDLAVMLADGGRCVRTWRRWRVSHRCSARSPRSRRRGG